jgi:hypothetical protein
MKLCKKCKVLKPLNSFSRNKNLKDGLQWWCKDCKKTHDGKRFLVPKERANFLLRSAKQRTIKWGGSITITTEWVESKIIKGVCEVTGIPFDLSPSNFKRMNPFAPSLDRIDSGSRDYSEENTRVVLASVNVALGEWGLEVMKPIFKKLGEL